MGLSSRERLVGAINHRETDRPPIDLGATAVTGMHSSTMAHLRRRLGLQERPLTMFEPFQCLGWVDDDLVERLGIDVAGVFAPTTMMGYRNKDWKPWRLPDGTEVWVGGGFVTRIEPNGDIVGFPGGDDTLAPSCKMPKDGTFFDAIIRDTGVDMDHLDPADFAEEFGAFTDDDLTHLRRQGERLRANTDLGVVGAFFDGGFGDIARVPGIGLKHPKGIRNPEDWIMAQVVCPDYLKGIFELHCQAVLKNLELYRQALGSNIDVIAMSGTDFGGQCAPLLSVDMFRDLYKPFFRRVNAWVHAHTDWKIFYHSCGAVEPLLEDFIDMGVDILNPVQCSSPGMDPKNLKAKYGDRLVFWGGGVDTQKTLPFGTPQEVRSEVEERSRIFAAGGGYVFAAIHNVVARVPAENVEAMFEAARG